MPNEPQNTHGTTLRQQLKAAAEATAQEQRARKEAAAQAKDAKTRTSHSAGKHKDASDVAAKGKGGVTKRRASKAQVNSLQERDQKKKDKSKQDAKEMLQDLKPLDAVKRFVGNMGLGWRILAVFVVSVLIVGVVLYPIGCTYYQAMRQEQQLQAVLDAVNERNQSIQDENDEL